jgi:lipocalin-like protein
MFSWTTKNVRTGETANGLGADPTSYLHYLPDGRMMVLVLRGERKAPSGLAPTVEEKLALYDSMVAYAGTYVFEGDKVIHRLDMSWNQAWTGSEQIRFCQLDGKRLTLTSPASKNPLDGENVVHTIVFEKIG